MSDIIEIGYLLPIEKTQDYKKYQDEAKGIFSDDPLRFLLDVANQEHKGDREVLETLILSRLSAHPLFNIKLNIALTGGSDEGKTHVGTTGLDIAPPQYKYETTKVSPKVLYYEAMGNPDKGILPYSFYNKTIFLDDITDNDREILKQIANTSNKPPSFSTLINQVPHKIIFDYAPVVWTSRVDLLDDIQADRRYYSVEVKSSPDVLSHIFKTEVNNVTPQETDDWLTAQVAMDMVMKANLIVQIPDFDYSFAKSKSGLKFLIAMIRSIAKINAMKNDVIDNKLVIASQEDIKEGVRLYKANHVQQHKLSKNALKILDYIPDDMPIESELENPDSSPHTVEAIYEEVKKEISIDIVRKELRSLYIKGLINTLPGKRNRQFYYKV